MGGEVNRKMVINEEVLAHLIEKAIKIEESNVNMLLKLFMAEDDENGRRILYDLLRDSELHKTKLIECLKGLKGSKIPEPDLTKHYDFEEMFYAEKAAILRKIKVVLRDYYRYLLEDLKRADVEKEIDPAVTKRVIPCLEFLVEEKERHVRLVSEVWKAY
ncbi:hypothetical protein GAH_00790 [Geoglobus ahangari]|uniref:Rubrerythrin diiron-binding domain-containing protein n=1 Tax=Geoglobus ahangari TaxID=113653 RepID=A0A0F7IFI8_9EURY|nr:hypothetical protein [Geoglobus ahangari]AKG91878.1 hypothetical protein GAH_00790 [Geoglobus ahangari]